MPCSIGSATSPPTSTRRRCAKALFATWDLPQAPDALRILDKDGRELFFWSPGMQCA